VRVAYSGDEADGLAQLEPLRRIAGLERDTIRRMTYAHVGDIHHDEIDVPVAAFDRNILLGDLDGDAVRMLSTQLGPGKSSRVVVELRAWGGALSRPPKVPNAIGFRGAAFSLLAISDGQPENRRQRDAVLAAMQPWSTGMTYPNFNGVEDTSIDAVRRSYAGADFRRLQQLRLPVLVSQLQSAPEPLTGGATPKPRHKKRV